MTSPLQIAIVGLGNVGTGVAKILTEHPERILMRAGRPIEIRRAVVRDLKKPRDIKLPSGVITDDLQSVIDDPNVEVAVELMGGIHPAFETVMALLEAGKDVVTANKALLCVHGEEIFNAANRLGRTVCFEAAVAGGIPIIAAVGQSMAANQIIGIQAILNGTTNYILTEMLFRGQSYSDALKDAQQLGYAEADPTLDVNGTDAAQKLGILTQLAFGTKVAAHEFHVSGIDKLEQVDFKHATNLGYVIKLLATVKLISGKLEMSVRATLIRNDRPLAQIHGPFNAILLDGDLVGNVWYSGRGAGQMPTASAVTADIIDLAIGRAQRTFKQLDLWRAATPEFPLMDAQEASSRYFMRLSVEDRPNVMAEVTGILGRHGISLATIIQPEAPEVDQNSTSVPIVPLIIMTHRTSAGNLAAAERDLDRLKSVRSPRMVLAVAD
jgi:homoserine dehydrogenase